MRPLGFYALATRFPQLLHNIGAILSDRLTAPTSTLSTEHGHVTVLHDHGGPPLLAYGLACSVAWHTRASTVLVVVGDTGSRRPRERCASGGGAGAGAACSIPPSGGFAPEALENTIEDLSHRYDHVSSSSPMGATEPGRRCTDATRGVLRLADATSPLPDCSGWRAGHTLRAAIGRVRAPARWRGCRLRAASRAG